MILQHLQHFPNLFSYLKIENETVKREKEKQKKNLSEQKNMLKVTIRKHT